MPKQSKLQLGNRVSESLDRSLPYQHKLGELTSVRAASSLVQKMASSFKLFDLEKADGEEIELYQA